MVGKVFKLTGYYNINRSLCTLATKLANNNNNKKKQLSCFLMDKTSERERERKKQNKGSAEGNCNGACYNWKSWTLKKETGEQYSWRACACRWNFFSKDKTVMSSSHWHSLPVQALAFTPEGTVCWQIITYVTLPFEMSCMDTRPLSYCGLFSKGASSIWICFCFLAKSDCPVFFVSEIILLMLKKKRKKEVYKSLNVIKWCFEHAPACC